MLDNASQVNKAEQPERKAMMINKNTGAAHPDYKENMRNMFYAR